MEIHGYTWQMHGNTWQYMAIHGNTGINGNTWQYLVIHSITWQYIEITSWLVSAYDFYSRVVKNRKRTSERSERVSLRFFTTRE